MSDNTTLNVGTLGDTIASDDIGGIKFQRIKLIFGPDNVNRGDVEEANPLPVKIATTSASAVFATTQTALANVSSVTSIAGGVTALTLFATTTTRQGACIWNESASRLYVKLGQGVTTTLFSFKVAPYGYWEMPPKGYGGAITGLWEVATGSAMLSSWSYS